MTTTTNTRSGGYCSACYLPLLEVLTMHSLRKVWQQNRSFTLLGLLFFIAASLISDLAIAQTAKVIFTNSGTFTVPAGVTSITVEAWGGGGAGGGAINTNNRQGGGGAGGAYRILTNIPVVPLTTYTIDIGSGGTASTGNGGNGGNTTAIFGANTVTANGGQGGTGANAGNGGGGLGGIGGTYNGGNGANGANNGNLGGGGSSAGTGANGTNGSTTNNSGGVAPAGGGNGGAGGNGADGTNGLLPGGGGGGGERTGGNDRNGGAGANGQIIISYANPNYFINPGTYTFTVPAGVFSITVEAWGGGGGGGNGNKSQGGGGGGAYASSTLTVTPGTIYTVVVGAGGTAGNSGTNSTFGTSIVIAAAGSAGGNNGGAGGTTGNSTGNTEKNGGNGGDRTDQSGSGGGGGGSGFTNADGGAGADGGGNNSNGGTGGAGTGNGGNGGYDNINGFRDGYNGIAPGGGGGGKADGGTTSGSGAPGQVLISWPSPVQYLAVFSTPNLGATNWCGGETRSVSFTVKNNGAATWTSTDPNGIKFSWWWNSQSGQDANPRVLPFTSLASGQSQTFTVNITAPTAPGNYTLNFDLVREGDCWFRNNTGNCGPGNATSNTVTGITVNQQPTVAAGANLVVCSNTGSIAIGADATGNNYTSIAWSTSNGTGLFVDNGDLNAVTYTPSPADIAAGTVTMVLTGYNNDCAVSATKTITFTPAPLVDAGDPVITCSNTGAVLVSGGASATNAASVAWTSNGTGLFSSPNTLATNYTPSVADIANGGVLLTLTATGNTGCTNVSANKALTITQAPLLAMGAPLTVCANATNIDITDGASANNVASILWSSLGGGSITNAGVINTATYTPGAADIANGSVTIRLTATGNSPCATEFIDRLITFTTPPTANAGADMKTCSNTGLVIIGAGATAANYSTVAWSSSGTGTFTNATDLNNATYTPSAADITAGSVVLTLTAYGNGSCNAEVDTKTLTITPLPVADFSYAGNPFCSNAANAVPTFLNGGIAGIFSSTAGLVFVNNTTGVINILASTPGTYTVTNTIAAANGCAEVTKTFDVTITPLPIAGFSYTASPYCSNGSNPVVTLVAGGTKGTFSSSAGLAFVSTATGEVDLLNSTAGTYTVTNTIAAADGCGLVSATSSITITKLPITGFSYAGSPYCSNGSNVLPVMDAGAAKGNFTALPSGLVINAATGEINMGASVAGTYTITNTIAAADGCAIVSSTFGITITPLPKAGFSYAGSPYCSSGSNPVVTLVSGATAGTFSSTAGLVFINATTGEIDIAASTPGTYTVTNTIAAATGCGVVTATANITITKLPLAGFSYTGSPFCSNGTNPSPVLNAGAVSGVFSAAAGLSINSSTGIINLAASTPGTYTVTNTIAAANGCGMVTGTYNITINQLPVASFSYPTASICKSAANPSPVFIGAGVAGSFTSSPAGLNFVNTATGEVNMSTSATGAYTITNTIAAANGCTEVTATFNLTITQDGTIGLSSGSATPTVCINTGLASNIVYTIGGTATGASVTGLPAGITGAYSAGQFTISGTPTASGTFNYTVTTTGACAAASASGTITVAPVPTVSLSSALKTDNQGVCVGSGITNITYTIGGSATGATVSGLPASINYNFSGGTLTISGTATAAVGTYNYTVTTTNSSGCTNATAAGTIRLYNTAPAVPGIISGSTSLCPTVTGLVYSVPNDNNVSYYDWQLPVGWTITNGLGTNSITVDVGGTATLATNTIRVAAQNPCGITATSNLAVEVNDFASVDAGPDREICQGGSVNIIALFGGSANEADWVVISGSGSFSPSSITKADPSTTFTPTGTGTFSIKLRSNTPAGTCDFNEDIAIITVKPTPTASISGSTTICDGGNATINFSGTPLSTVTYKINGGADQTIDLDGLGNASINTGSLSTNATYSLQSVTYTTAPLCLAPVSGSATITVNQPVLVNAGAVQTVCANGSITLAGNISGGITTGTWSAPIGTGSFSSATNLAATFTPSIASGTVLLTLTSDDPAGPCDAASSTVLITVNPLATVNAGLAQTVCSNGSIDLAGSFGGAATGATWSAPSGTFSNVNSMVSTYTPAIASGNVVLTLTSNDPAGPCTAAVSTVTITVNAAVTANAGSAQTVCAGGTITLAGTVTGGASTGVWTAPSGSFSNASLLNSTYTPSITSGKVVLTLTSADPDAVGPCAVSISTVEITVNEAATVSAGSNVATCPGIPVSLSGTLGGSATSAVWSAPSGSFSNVNSLTSTYTPTIGSGSVTLTLTSNDPDGVGPCVVASSTMAVSITTPPADPANPTATTPGCGSVTITKNGTPAANIVWYWQTSANGTSISQNASADWTVTSSGTYYIRAFSTATGCWSNNAGSVTVVVNALPNAPAAPSSNSPQCSDPGVVLTMGTAPGGETWFWQTSSTGTDVAAINSAPTFTVVTSGTYYLRSRNNTTLCWSAATAFVVNVTPAPATPPAPTSGATQCEDIGTTLTASGTAPAGTTWYWQSVATGIGTGNSGATYIVTTSGTYYLRARDNGTGCWSPAVSVATTVNPSPATPTTPTISAGPNCGSTTITAVAPPANILWYWQTAANGTDITNSNTTYNVTTSGNYYLRARNTISGCWSTGAAQVTVTINTVPAAPTLTSNSPQCSGVGVTINSGTPPAGEIWYWQASAIGTSTADAAATKLAATSGTYYLRSQTSAGCWSAAASLAVVVNPLPVAPGNPTASASACEDVGVTLTKPGGQPGGEQWFWQTSATGTDQTYFANTFTSLQAGTYNVYLRAMNTTTQCWSAGAGVGSIIVKDNPLPSLAAYYCEVPGKVRLRATSSIAITSYNWTPIIPPGNPNTNAIYDVDVASRFYNTLVYTNGCSRQNFIDVAQNLVINGDFEANVDYRNPATRGFRTEYIWRAKPTLADRNLGCTALVPCLQDSVPLPNCGGDCSPGLYNETTYTVDFNANDFHGDFWGRDYTTGSGKFLMINGSRNLLNGNLRVIWEQTITVQPGTDYYFSAMAMNLNPASPAELRFEINGVQVGTIAYLNGAPAPTNASQVSRTNWVRFYSNPTWNSGANTTAVVRIINLNPEAGGNDFGLDDISFGTLAPNPVKIVNVIAESPVCPGESITLAGTISGGKAPFTYTWLGPNGFSSNLQNPVIPSAVAAHSGTYTLQVKDGYNCIPQATENSNSVVVLSGTPGIWTGAGNTDWFWCRNWASGTLPNNVIDVSLPPAAIANALIDPATSTYYGGTLNGSLPARSRNITIDKILSFGATGRLNTYGNLTITNTAGSAVNMTPGGEIYLRGNWINSRGTAGFTAGVGQVTMEGSVLQSISSVGLLESFYDLRMDNSSGAANGVIVLSDAFVNRTLTLKNGYLHTFSLPPAGGPPATWPVAKELTIGPAGTAVAGPPGVQSFVTGRLAKQFNNAGPATEFEYPIGKVGAPMPYRPASVVPTTTDGTTTFYAEYFPYPHPTPTTLGASLFGLIKPEYWQIDRQAGKTANARVKLNYINPGSGNWIGAGNLATIDPCSNCNVAVIHKDVNGLYSFTGLPPNSTDPEYRFYANNGHIYSKAMSTFSPFSIGFSYNVILPIQILSFDGRLVGNETLLKWKLNANQDIAGFEVQTSRDGINYSRLGFVKYTNAEEYQFVHKNPVGGPNYYRLLMQERNGATVYSTVVVVQLGWTPITVIKGLQTNPVRSEAVINIFSASAQRVQARLIDISGRVLGETNEAMLLGNNQLRVKTQMLSQGIYQIQVLTQDGQRAILRIMKE